jgi:hypothetical protein
MSLVLGGSPSPRAAQTDLYIEIAQATQSVDVIVGNRGTAVSLDNFDALLEAEWKGKVLCRATTNFITPIGPGESIRALRFEVAATQPAAMQPYTIRASIRFWDRGRKGRQEQMIVALPLGRATCLLLKPAQ